MQWCIVENNKQQVTQSYPDTGPEGALSQLATSSAVM